MSTYRLCSAKDETSGSEVRYTYDLLGRISSVSEYGDGDVGQTIIYTYRPSETQVRTSGSDDIIATEDDIITHYTLDYAGRAIGTYSSDVSGQTIYGATYGSYSPEDNQDDYAVNSLKSSTITNSVVENYIQNGGFTEPIDTDVWTLSDGVGRCTTVERNVVAYLHFDMRRSGDKYAYQNVILQTGKQYTLSADCDSNTDAGATIELTVQSLQDTNEVYRSTQLLAMIKPVIA